MKKIFKSVWGEIIYEEKLRTISIIKKDSNHYDIVAYGSFGSKSFVLGEFYSYEKAKEKLLKIQKLIGTPNWMISDIYPLTIYNHNYSDGCKVAEKDDKYYIWEKLDNGISVALKCFSTKQEAEKEYNSMIAGFGTLIGF